MSKTQRLSDGKEVAVLPDLLPLSPLSPGVCLCAFVCVFGPPECINDGELGAEEPPLTPTQRHTPTLPEPAPLSSVKQIHTCKNDTHSRALCF